MMVDVTEPEAVTPPKERKTRKRRATAPKPKPTNGRKTLVAAVVACILAIADLWVTVRLGVKLW